MMLLFAELPDQLPEKDACVGILMLIHKLSVTVS